MIIKMPIPPFLSPKVRHLIVPIGAILAIVLAISLLVGLVVSGQQNKAATDRKLARVVREDKAALQKSIADNQSHLCFLSRKRWVVQHDVILKLSLPIDPSLAPDPVSHHRIEVYNVQQATSRLTLLGELGPQPSLC